jgi:hypothetical protein
LRTNNRLGLSWPEVTNTLAYYDKLKSCIRFDYLRWGLDNSTNIRLGLNWPAVTNTLAYYNKLKSCIKFVYPKVCLRLLHKY